jgi:hypothetical protein
MGLSVEIFNSDPWMYNDPGPSAQAAGLDVSNYKREISTWEVLWKAVSQFANDGLHA